MTRPDEDFAPGEHLDPDERDPETPQADAVEQATTADPAEEEPEVHRGLEVTDYDATEQARALPPEDDYR